MTTMTANRRAYAQELADEYCREYRADSSLDSDDRAWNALSVLSLMIFEIDELDLRDTLTLAGMDLTNDEDWEIARQMVALFVRAGCIEVQNLMIPTILDLNTPLVYQYDDSEELRADLDRIKADGIFWREFLLPEHVG